MKSAVESANNLPGFDRYELQARSSWNEAADRLVNNHVRMFNKDYVTAREQGRVSNDNKFQTGVLEATFNDLTETLQAASKLTNEMNKHGGMKDLLTHSFPAMLDAAGKAIKLYQGSHKELASPDKMQVQFMNEMKRISKNSPSSQAANLFNIMSQKGNEDVQTAVWKYLFQISAPQHKKTSFMNDRFFSFDTSLEGQPFKSFRESLPSKFQTVPVKPTQMFKGKSWINRKESDLAKVEDGLVDKLVDQMFGNRFMLDAAVAAGVAKKVNGTLQLNNSAINRGQVNMMAGHLMKELENSLLGMPMYGVKDVEDPSSWDKLSRKNNKRYNMAMEAMHFMNDIEWLSPAYYSSQQAKILHGDAKNWTFSALDPKKYGKGVIKHAPIYKAFEVPTFSIAKDGNLVEDAHLAIEDSISMRRIMEANAKLNKREIKGHNALIDDVVYLNVDHRLSDPNLPEYEREKILGDIAKYWDEGITFPGYEGRYVGVGVSKDRGLEFIPEKVRDSIEKKDPGFFTGGHVIQDAKGKLIPKTDFESWTAFSSAVEYARKVNTPGEDSRTLFGGDLPTEIIVFDPSKWRKEETPEGVLGKIPGLDGASFADSKIIPFGAQGRMEGIKTALTSVNLDNVINEYLRGSDKDFIEIAGAVGEGATPETVKLRRGLQMLISKNDIKDFDRRFKGKSNAEITKAVLEDIQRSGISVKTPFESAETQSRWISSQLAQTLSITHEDQKLFNKVFMDELARTNTAGIVDTVFAGNKPMLDMLKKNPYLIDSPMVQTQIRGYRQNLIQRKSRGDILLPKEMVSHRQMIAPWIYDVLNSSILSQNKDAYIPEELKKLSLQDKEVIALASLRDKFGISRLPATLGSAQLVDNLAGLNSGSIDENQFRKFASIAGLDSHGLYFNPNSSILAALQGADFDGDIVEIIEFASDANNTYDDMVKHILERTVESHSRMIKSGKLSKEASEKKLDGLKKTLENEDQVYSLKSGKDIARIVNNAALMSSRIGSANAVTRNAFQMDRTQDFVLKAMVDAYDHYDQNTVALKKGFM